MNYDSWLQMDDREEVWERRKIEKAVDILKHPRLSEDEKIEELLDLDFEPYQIERIKNNLY